MLVYGECECFVMQMLYVCVLCASCGQFSMPCGTPVFKLTLFGCVISIFCVGFASP